MKCAERVPRETELGISAGLCSENTVGSGHHCRRHAAARLAITQQRLLEISHRMQQRVGEIVRVELQMTVLEQAQAKDRNAYLADYQLAQEIEADLQAVGSEGAPA